MKGGRRYVVALAVVTSVVVVAATAALAWSRISERNDTVLDRVRRDRAAETAVDVAAVLDPLSVSLDGFAEIIERFGLTTDSELAEAVGALRLAEDGDPIRSVMVLRADSMNDQEVDISTVAQFVSDDEQSTVLELDSALSLLPTWSSPAWQALSPSQAAQLGTSARSDSVSLARPIAVRNSFRGWVIAVVSEAAIADAARAVGQVEISIVQPAQPPMIDDKGVWSQTIALPRFGLDWSITVAFGPDDLEFDDIPLAMVPATAVLLLALLLGALRWWVRSSRRVAALDEQVQTEARRASRDALTGVLSRSAIVSVIDEAAATQPHGHVAVLYCDLDRFKPINDIYGHQTGDDVLRLVVQRWQRCLPDGSSLGRVGGDEFVVVVEASRSEAVALALADRIVSSLVEPIEVGHHQHGVGVSIGIAVNQPGATATSLLQEADDAMYEAKRGAAPIVVADDRDVRPSTELDVVAQRQAR
jgi:diguanylate cyclase (GGDEF)-like protein